VLQQEQIRRELERRQALSEALFQSVDEGVVVVRLEDFRIVRTNHEAATLLGRSPDKLVGEEIARVLSWPELGDASSWDTSSPIVREIEVSRSCDGKPAHLEALVQRFSYGGETFGVILLRDVEERRQVEERIRHAVKSEAIGRLAGGVAHDFNNLLTVINGNAELLLEDLEPGSVPAQRAREIYRAGQKAAQLVSQLLSYSRRQFLQTTVLNPADVLNGIRRMLERVLGKNVNLCVETPGEVPAVKADRRQLEQVFLNLAENARDAMPEGGVFTIVFSQVEISRTEAEQFEGLTPGRFLEIKVSDTGTGVPEGLGDRIFDPFVTTKEVGKGSGLGLASVYGVVRQHGGMITLASRPGEAARFRILLPAYCPREQANGKAGGMSA
ncbi:MAG TPA: ATP-binding protein, partial [Acidobacteriota bacterium]|nr:ATP-binding protein [Acidobacteriota bacterium]